MTNKIFTAVLALSLLSCSKSVNEETISDSRLINFGTYAGLADSRALDKDKFVGTDKIGVSAFHHTADLSGQVFVDNFFKSLPVTAQGTADAAPTSWTYDSPRYWPTGADERLSFVACHPSTQPITVAPTTGVISITDFMPAATADAQVDLLWAGVPNKIGSTSKATKVNFTFKHALAKVVFTAKLTKTPDVNGNATAIKSIELVDLASKGTYTYGTVAAATPATRVDVPGVDWPVGTWALGTDVATYSPFGTGAEPTIIPSTEPTVIGESLLMLPQEVSLQNKVFVITYTVTPKIGDAPISTTSTFHLIPRNDWEQNKQYIYSMTIDSKDPILFTEVVIEDWIDGGAEEKPIDPAA